MVQCSCLAAISCFHKLNKLVLRNWPGGLNYVQAEAIGSLCHLEHLEIVLGNEWGTYSSRSWNADGFYRCGTSSLITAHSAKQLAILVT